MPHAGYLTAAPSTFNTQDTHFPYMSNPSWEVSQREQMLQNQLLQERQQFEAWKARHAQPQVSQMQAHQMVPSGPTVSEKVKIDDDVEVFSVRSASAKRARPRDQAAVNVSKRARSSASTSSRSLSPRRDYPRGTSPVRRPSQASPKYAEDRSVHSQDLEFFKADMTSMLADMLKSFLSNFASQLKSSSGGQGESKSTQNVTSDQEKEPLDHDSRLESGDLASVEDPAEIRG